MYNLDVMNRAHLLVFSMLGSSVALADIPLGEVVPVKLPPTVKTVPEVTAPAEKPANPVAKAAGDLVEAAVVKAAEQSQKPDPLETIKAETAKLVAEREKITAQMALDQALQDEKFAERKRAMAEIQMRIDEMETQMDLAETEERTKNAAATLALRLKGEKLGLESLAAKNEVDTEGYRMKQEENAIRRQTSALALEIELQQKQSEARTYAGAKTPTYLKDPLQGRKLILSDRTIPLNGVITSKTADSLADRIAYFNNRDAEAPIFIVIDDCPGGSVMAGYKIIKAMHGSKAPVYTVVKSFAASMAACITTVSKRSFAYPNAIILHHQLSAGVMGNLTQQRESVKELEEWWKRLADPVAEKMGITREEFITRMYKKSSTGDWNEFADDAQKLGWVDTIVDEIEETALLRHPDTQQPATTTLIRTAGVDAIDNGVVEAKDEHGRPAAMLPRLNPLDAYWMYNPDGFYRMQ
ncbi:ATP-dependent Clp protease, protease subunit [Prosthecobacter debontii]|uniref:ATP-dependent Clp protease, protease subunit n=2 Tax=Prosthecobacter debontii TaxID=48467 RepID=A0A1T4Z5M0_9BACT|nr:ATP-dependent Clp protease, protease subunit [Prosthecobacter debontii]